VKVLQGIQRKKKDFSERFVTHFAQQVKKWGFVVQFPRRDSVKPRQTRLFFSEKLCSTSPVFGTCCAILGETRNPPMLPWEQ